MYGLTEIQLMETTSQMFGGKGGTRPELVRISAAATIKTAKTLGLTISEVLDASIDVPITHGEWEERQRGK